MNEKYFWDIHHNWSCTHGESFMYWCYFYYRTANEWAVQFPTLGMDAVLPQNAPIPMENTKADTEHLPNGWDICASYHCPPASDPKCNKGYSHQPIVTNPFTTLHDIHPQQCTTCAITHRAHLRAHLQAQLRAQLRAHLQLTYRLTYRLTYELTYSSLTGPITGSRMG